MKKVCNTCVHVFGFATPDRYSDVQVSKLTRWPLSVKFTVVILTQKSRSKFISCL